MYMYIYVYTHTYTHIYLHKLMNMYFNVCIYDLMCVFIQPIEMPNYQVPFLQTSPVQLVFLS